MFVNFFTDQRQNGCDGLFCCGWLMFVVHGADIVEFLFIVVIIVMTS